MMAKKSLISTQYKAKQTVLFTTTNSEKSNFRLIILLMFPPFNFFGNDAVKYIIEADDATSDNKGRFTFIFLLCSSPGGSMYVPTLIVFFSSTLFSSELSTHFLHSKTDN